MTPPHTPPPHGDPDRELERTLEQSPDETRHRNELARAKAHHDAKLIATETSDHIERTVVHRSRPRPLTPNIADSTEGSRYTMGELLGVGAGGRVFAMHDTVLMREVAVKIFESGGTPQDLESFSEEARIAAELEHPNITPMYDMDVDENSQAYFTMKRIHGKSLRDLIAQKSKETSPESSETDELVRIFIKVCDAVAYAHARSVIHQDIKPANIMVGKFGEVILVDWGTARKITATKASTVRTGPTGTPAYMSPEQARSEDMGPACDIYAIGASLFHALTLRHPVTASTTDEFWLKKREGIVDPPTREESRSLPPRLLAIAMHAMKALPGQRYPTVDALAADLKNYQAGLAISAYRDGFGDWLRRWYGRNRRTIAFTSVIALLLTAGGWFFYAQKIREYAAWGSPIWRESFDSSGDWKKHWTTASGRFEIRNGVLVTLADSNSTIINSIVFNRKMYGGVAIEYDGMYRSGVQAGDLSAFWAENMVLSDSGDSVVAPGKITQTQTGAFDNSYSLITGTRDEKLAYNPFRLQEGVRYRIRAVFDDNRISLIVNGQLICSYEGPTALSVGYVGLLGCYPGKEFDNIRIYRKEPALLIPAIKVADSYFRKGRIEDALEEYRLIDAAHGSAREGTEARYRMGLCMKELGYSDSAFALWETLRHSPLRGKVFGHMVDRFTQEGSVDSVIRHFPAFYRDTPAADRLYLAEAGARFLKHLLDSCEYRSVQRALDSLEPLHLESPAYAEALSRALIAFGRPQEVLTRFPGYGFQCTDALAAMYRFQDIIDNYPSQRFPSFFALLTMDRASEVLDRYPDVHWFKTFALQFLCRFEECIEFGKKYPPHDFGSLHYTGRDTDILGDSTADASARALALNALGRYAEVLEKEVAASASRRATAFIGLGRYDEAMRHGRTDQFRYQEAGIRKGMSRTALLDSAGIPLNTEAEYYYTLEKYLHTPGDFSLFDSLQHLPLGYFNHGFVFSHYLMVPFLRHLENNTVNLDSAYADLLANRRASLMRRLWHAAALVTGRITEAQFMAQPVKLEIQARALLYGAMGDEYKKSPASALSRYRAYSVLPLYKREKDPIVDLFVKWRIKQLSGSSGESRW